MSKLAVLNTKKEVFKISNKTETSAEILVYGEIGDTWYDEASVSATQFANILKEIGPSVKNIDLRFNSVGGSVFDGMSIYEKIKSERSKGKTFTAYIDGMACSIASVIILACDEVVVGEGSFIMIHKPLVGAYGNASELERMIVILDKIEEQMIGIYARKTGLSRAEIAIMLEKETWFTSEEALENGLADSQVENASTMKLVASAMGGAKFKNAPKAMPSISAIAKTKLKAFNNLKK